MVAFTTDERPVRDHKPHMKADGQTILFRMPSGYRMGFAEDGHQFGVAKWVYEDYTRKFAPTPKQ